MRQQLSELTKIVSALDHAEGNSDRNGATLDMAGFDGVLMVVKFGDIAAGAITSIKAQYGDESNLGDVENISGASITVADDDDDQIFVIDVFRPTKRYVRVLVDKDASNNTEEMAWYLQYDARNKPATFQVADLVTLDTVVEV